MTDPHQNETHSYDGSQVIPPVGTVVGGYHIESLLGVGGMGEVYRATDPKLGRAVALKLVRPAVDGPAAHMRLLREARAAAAVVHDHVVRVYQVGEDRGTPFIAMELLAGQSLASRLVAGPIPPAEVVRIAVEAASGIVAVHAAGLVHRDVKPANLWLEAGHGRVKLLDFGLARSDGDATLTQPGALVGTPAYMAPEQAAGRPVDHRADLFSLGCVLYHMATGRRAFEGSNVLTVLGLLASHTPPPADAVNTAVPRALAELIDRLLAKDPIARPPSATAVASQLHELDLAVPPAPQAGPSDPTRTASETAAPSDRQRMLAMLLELKEQQKLELLSRDSLIGCAAGLLILVGLPLLCGAIGALVDKSKKTEFVGLGCGVAILTWAIPPALYAKRQWMRKRDRLIDAFTQAFPEKSADWGGPTALRNETTLAAIISRVQGL